MDRVLVFLVPLNSNEGFLGGSVVKNLPAIQETQVQSLGWEDPLEKEMATHSRILNWEIPWTEEAGRLQFTGSQKSQIQLSGQTTTSLSGYTMVGHL